MMEGLTLWNAKHALEPLPRQASLLWVHNDRRAAPLQQPPVEAK